MVSRVPKGRLPRGHDMTRMRHDFLEIETQYQRASFEHPVATKIFQAFPEFLTVREKICDNDTGSLILSIEIPRKRGGEGTRFAKRDVRRNAYQPECPLIGDAIARNDPSLFSKPTFRDTVVRGTQYARPKKKRAEY